MILIDANILIYAHVNSFDQHQAARDWLDKQLNGSAPVGLPWASVLAFLRLVTNPRVLEHPESILDAWVQARTWLACETVWLSQPIDRTARRPARRIPRAAGRTRQSGAGRSYGRAGSGAWAYAVLDGR